MQPHRCLKTETLHKPAGNAARGFCAQYKVTTMTAINETAVLAPYTNLFKGWSLPQLGPKPAAELLHLVHGLACRPGKQALALAMALRDCGVSASQIVIACGAPQNNKRREVIGRGDLRPVPMAPDTRGHTVYRVELTPKGKARVERADAAAAAAVAKGEAEVPAKAPTKAKGEPKAKAAGAKPTKAKGTSKARKAKVEPDNVTVLGEPVLGEPVLGEPTPAADVSQHNPPAGTPAETE